MKQSPQTVEEMGGTAFQELPESCRCNSGQAGMICIDWPVSGNLASQLERPLVAEAV
jgi:hypothetical protein